MFLGCSYNAPISACLHVTVSSVLVSLCPFSYKHPSCKRRMLVRPIPAQDDLVSRPFITSAKTIFPNKVTLTGTEDQDLDISFGEHNQPTTPGDRKRESPQEAGLRRGNGDSPAGGQSQ